MKFVKSAIVLLFLLSLLSAGATYYLSTIRENEKDKRLSAEAESARLETEKSELANQLDGLSEELAAEKQAHGETKELLRQKEEALEQLKRETSKDQKALEEAQKRNDELERILSQLELRMQQADAQRNLTPGGEAGFINVTVSPSEKGQAPSPLPSSADPLTVEPHVVEQAQAEASQGSASVARTVTPLPEPPKRRRFLSFLRPNEETEPELPAPATAEYGGASAGQSVLKITETREPVTISEPLKSEPLKAEEKPKAIAPPQTLAFAQESPKTPPPTAQPVQVPAQTASKPNPAAAQGSVLLVNRKYNFVVVNLGTRHGISLDDMLSIQHQGSKIAKARVEKLYDDYCAAYITEEQSEHPIGEGDAVVTA